MIRLVNNGVDVIGVGATPGRTSSRRRWPRQPVQRDDREEPRPGADLRRQQRSAYGQQRRHRRHRLSVPDRVLGGGHHRRPREPNRQGERPLRSQQHQRLHRSLPPERAVLVHRHRGEPLSPAPSTRSRSHRSRSGSAATGRRQRNGRRRRCHEHPHYLRGRLGGVDLHAARRRRHHARQRLRPGNLDRGGQPAPPAVRHQYLLGRDHRAVRGGSHRQAGDRHRQPGRQPGHTGPAGPACDLRADGRRQGLGLDPQPRRHALAEPRGARRRRRSTQHERRSPAHCRCRARSLRAASFTSTTSRSSARSARASMSTGRSASMRARATCACTARRAPGARLCPRDRLGAHRRLHRQRARRHRHLRHRWPGARCPDDACARRAVHVGSTARTAAAWMSTRRPPARWRC